MTARNPDILDNDFSSDGGENRQKALGRYRFNGFNLIISSLVINILSLALPLLLLQIYDRIIVNQSTSTLHVLMAGVGIALVMEAVLRITRSYVTGWEAAYYEHTQTCRAVKHLLDSDTTAFERTAPSLHLQRLLSINKLGDFYGGQGLISLVDVPFVVIFMALIAYLGGWLVMVPVVLLVTFIFSALYIGKRLKGSLEERIETNNRKLDFIIEVITGIHTVKSMAMEPQMMRRFDRLQKEVTENSYQVAQDGMWLTNLGSVFAQVAIVMMVICGSVLVMDDKLSLGSLAACTLLIGRIMQPVQRALGVWTRFQEFSVARQQAEDIFTVPTHSRLSAVGLPMPRGEIFLNEVSFRYEPNVPLLQDVTLDIKPGSAIAIIGDKGEGKTTLLQLIMGNIVPDKGSVRIDGINPSSYNPTDLAGFIGYMPQRGGFFRGTVLENLTGFRDDKSTVAYAKEVARELGIDKIVAALPKGYDTYLTDGPADPISPGMKQRIALGRALVDHPGIILFDDADRALDKEGYNLVFKLIGKLKGRSTLIIVSQDQNLQSFADHFYTLKEGYLVPTDAPSSFNNLAMFNLLGK